MSQTQSFHTMVAGETPTERAPGTIPLITLGLGLSSFFAVSYLICIFGYLALPGLPVAHASLVIFLPGFALLSWRSFFLGLAESVLWGWYVALVFGWLYNFFLRWAR